MIIDIQDTFLESSSNILNNSKIIVSEQDSNILKKIKKTIFNNSSQKFIFGENYNFNKNTKGFVYEDKFGKINLPLPNLLGDFQISNVSTAIAAARILKQFNISKTHIKKAITKIRSEGRLQKITQGNLLKYISKKNEILVDGAHNPLAASAVIKYLETLGRKRKIIMVLGMMANKEHKEFIQAFKNIIHSMVVLDIPNQINFFEKKKLLKIAQSCGIPSKTESSLELAFKNIAKENDNAVIFCTGSLYFVGEILNLN